MTNDRGAQSGRFENSDSWDRRVAGYSGLLGVAAGAAGFLIDRMWEFPPTGTTGAELLAFASDRRTALLVAMLLNTLGVALWLVFGAGVWAYMRRRVGDTLLAGCFGLGLVSFVILLLAGFTAFFVLVYRAPSVRDPLLLYDLTFGLLALSGAPTAVALAAFGLDVARTAMLPRSTAWVAAVGAIAHVLLFASLIVRDGFWSLEGPVIMVIPATLFAWIASTSIALLRAGPRE